MATIETEVTANKKSPTDVRPSVRASRKGSESIIDRVLRMFSSVRFGIIMLLLVLACCMIGMLDHAAKHRRDSASTMKT